MTIAGVTIPRGEIVFAVLGSANRDERQFADPDTLDIDREPNRHLSFGQGVHFCLGASLARLEGQIAISTLLRRAHGLRLAVPGAALRHRPALILRGLQSLPVKFSGRRAPLIHSAQHGTLLASLLRPLNKGATPCRTIPTSSQ